MSSRALLLLMRQGVEHCCCQSSRASVKGVGERERVKCAFLIFEYDSCDANADPADPAACLPAVWRRDCRCSIHYPPRDCHLNFPKLPTPRPAADVKPWAEATTANFLQRRCHHPRFSRLLALCPAYVAARPCPPASPPAWAFPPDSPVPRPSRAGERH